MNIRAGFFAFLCCSLLVSFAQKNITFRGQLDYTPTGSSLWGYTAPDGHEWVLMGVRNGTSIVDIANPADPKQKFFINGTGSTWREMKTYGHYAYVSLDGTPDGRPDNGILIINLQYLPDSIQSYYWKGDSTHKLENSHTLVVEGDHLYINGHDVPGTKRGTVICDLKADPYRPTIVGLYDAAYVHDCFVRNDTMWTAEVYDGNCAVVDISDKSAPQLLTTFQTPSRFTHNTWLSDDSKTLYTTDEKKFAVVGVYNVEDIFDIEKINQFQSTPGTAVIPHNVRVLNDYLVISYYTDGVIIADALDPENIIKTGFYDTSPAFSDGTFNGCWEAYPFFPSGLIAAADIEKGLYILQPTYVRACYLHGLARDFFTEEPIQDVSINIIQTPDTTSIKLASTQSKADGTFKSGVADAGTFSVWAKKAGYYPVVRPDKEFTNGDTTYIEFFMIADSVDTIGLGITALEVNTLEVFPTLSSDLVRITLPETGRGQLTGVLVNMQGQVLKKINISRQTDNFDIDLSAFPAGRYALSLSASDGQRYLASLVRI